MPMHLKGQAVLKRPMDLTEWAYNSIKQLILDNTLTADTQINIDAMAAQLSISRTPVREALMRLQTQGLVRIVPHVGCFVCGLTRETTHDIFELRRIIESYAAKKAAESFSDEELQQWMDKITGSEQAVLQGNIEEFNEMETAIHNLLVTNLHNKRIEDVMDMVADNIYRQRIIATKAQDNVKLSLEEHRRIVEAIVARDPDEAGKAMEDHLLNVEARMMANLVFGDNS